MSGNTILVTGATSGIGLGLAQRFHAEGNTVIIAGRREQLLASIVAAHAGMDSVVLDVADPVSIRRGVATVIDRHPDLNTVINNAGIMLPEDLTDSGHLAVAEQTVATNLLGPIRLLAEVVPPGVQTDLMGQAARGQGMALDAFLIEVMDILRTDPDAREICVKDVLILRDAEAEGRHDDVLAMLSGAH